MTIHHVVTINLDPAVQKTLGHIEHSLALLLQMENRLMAKIDDLVQEVTDETTLIDGIGTFIQGIKDQLTTQGLDAAKVDQALAVVVANRAKLAAALTANVPPTPSGP